MTLLLDKALLLASNKGVFSEQVIHSEVELVDALRKGTKSAPSQARSHRGSHRGSCRGSRPSLAGLITLATAGFPPLFAENRLKLLLVV